MNESNLSIVTFWIDDQRFALPLACVEEVIRAVAIRTVAGTSEMIQGVIDFHGTIIPTINLRRRFGLPERSIAVNDRIIIVDADQRKLAAVVDQVGSIKHVCKDDLAYLPIGGRADFQGNKEDSNMLDPILLRDKDGIVVIYQLHRLINNDMMMELDKLVQQENPNSP